MKSYSENLNSVYILKWSQWAGQVAHLRENKAMDLKK
jgi:hypothetical protein